MNIEIFYTDGKLLLSEDCSKQSILQELDEKGVLTITFKAFQGANEISYPTSQVKMEKAIDETEEDICRFIINLTKIKEKLSPTATTQSSTQELASGKIGVCNLIFQAKLSQI